jgi:predicted ATPase/DNA-binding SARP family transcriptional activator
MLTNNSHAELLVGLASGAPVLEARFLGQFDVRLEDKPVVIPSRAAQSLFAYLLLNAGTAFRREKLAGQLWPDTPEETARRNLRQELWRLRKALEPDGTVYLHADDLTISFPLTEACWLDVGVLKRAGADGGSADLMQSLAAYQGELLPGFYDEWATLERGHLQALFEHKMQRLLEQLAAEERWAEALTWAERWIAQGQVPEPAHRTLLLAYGALGDMSKVAATFERCVVALRDDLGIEPSEQTLALYERLRAGGVAGKGATTPISPHPTAEPAPSSAAAGLLSGQLPDSLMQFDTGEHRLKGLLNPKHLRQVVAPDLPQDFPPPPSLNTIPNNLPIQVTSFIGRDRELSELQLLLSTARLLTLTGSGGTGKTRLSLQVAAEVLDSFKDGVWFVELAPLCDPALVPVTIALALGVREESSRPPLVTLLEWLRPKELLLILDNCEHLIDACAKFADAAIHASRGTRILASSREALGIAGEQTYPVPSLSMPDALPAGSGPQARRAAAEPPRIDAVPVTESFRPEMIAEYLRHYESVRLFVERATAVRPHFTLTDDNAAAIAQVCRRLDGIPLAIELAAARVRALNSEQIAARLDDRFRLLIGGSRTALPRQQTLLATIDWSYGLLTEPERMLLRRLSVFVDGWTLEAVEEVVSSEWQEADSRGASNSSSEASHPLATSHLPRADILDTLSHLVDKSLVVADGAGAAEAARYHLLETMRQYAREKLLESNETNAIRDRHLSFFLRLAEEAEPHLTGPAQATWFARLERDYANLRAALEWSLQEVDASRGMRLATALATLWHVRGPATEGVDWLVRAVSRLEAAAPSLVRAKALQATARVLTNTGELARSNPYVEESLAISRALEYRPGVARALFLLGMNARYQGDLKTSMPLLEQSLAIREGLDSDAIVRIYVNLGWIAAIEVDYDSARTYLEQAMAVAQAAGSSHSVALTFAHLGILAFLQRDYASAEMTFEQGLNAGRAIGSKSAVSISSRGLAYVALHRGQVERAAALCRESLLTNREQRDPLGLAACLAACAALAVARGQPERAGRLYGSAAARLVGNMGGRHRIPHDQAEQERYINILRAQLDEATFNAAWQAGYALTLDQAVAEAEQAAQPERTASPPNAALANPAGRAARKR